MNKFIPSGVYCTDFDSDSPKNQICLLCRTALGYHGYDVGCVAWPKMKKYPLRIHIIEEKFFRHFQVMGIMKQWKLERVL